MIPQYAEHIIAWFTLIVFSGIFLVLALKGLWYVCLVFPRFHSGAPNADIKMIAYSQNYIVGTTPRVFQDLKVCRWYGCSSRNKTNWFFGLMRFEKNKS